jgi:hypothetical protein
MQKIVIAITGLFLFAGVPGASAQTALKGSRTAMKKQNTIAQKQDYSFLRTASDVRRFVERGLLVPVKSAGAVKLADVSFPYTRPAVKTFIDRLAPQYQAACGERLVVTSLTRPLSRQPYNASELSVHPAGMAIDLRTPRRASCRRWLENTLLSLEKKGVLEATRERRPAHYHVAIFPAQYLSYVSTITGSKSGTTKAGLKIATGGKPNYASVIPSGPAGDRYKVRPGDSLWSIGRKHGVTVTELKQANGLSSARIKVGQLLKIPTGDAPQQAE